MRRIPVLAAVAVGVLVAIVVVVVALTIESNVTQHENANRARDCKQAVYNKAAAIYYGNLASEIRTLKPQEGDTELRKEVNRRGDILYAFLATAATTRDDQSRTQGFYAPECKRLRPEVKHQLGKLEKIGGVIRPKGAAPGLETFRKPRSPVELDSE